MSDLGYLVDITGQRHRIKEEKPTTEGKPALWCYDGTFRELELLVKKGDDWYSRKLTDTEKGLVEAGVKFERAEPAPQGVETRTMRSLDAMLKEIDAEPEANDLIQDLLPDSSSAYMLLCGRSGIGKTFLALDILHCLASGTPFLSHKTKPCKVGYLSMEGARAKIATRFRTIGNSFEGAHDNIFWEHSLPITLNAEGVNKLKEIIAGITVIIIDPLRPLVPGDYTSPKDATLFLKNLQRIQNETGTRLILLHHIRKPDKRYKVQPEDLQYEVKGASEYVEAATTVLLLERVRQSKDVYGKFRSINPKEKELHFVKVKDAPTDLKPVRLRFNDDTLLFEPVTYDYEEDLNT